VKAVSHPSCIPGKCGGLSLRKAREKMVDIAVDEFVCHLDEKGTIRQMIRKFPALKGKTVKLTIGNKPKYYVIHKRKAVGST
jgi:hypothetical protein